MLKLLFIFFVLFLAHPTNASPTSVLFLGDSLTEGYGIDKTKAFPDLVKGLVAARLKKEIKVINGGVSGSTAASGLSRMKWFFKNEKPNLVILALGSNDGLRGFDLDDTKKNLQQIIKFGHEQKSKVILVGMLMPPNYGLKYTEKFKNMFLDLSKKENVPLIPFLLKDVAGKKEYNLSDGIHPNESGHIIIAETIFTSIKDYL